jgi:hypothetical protein
VRKRSLTLQGSLDDGKSGVKTWAAKDTSRGIIAGIGKIRFRDANFVDSSRVLAMLSRGSHEKQMQIILRGPALRLSAEWQACESSAARRVETV